MEGTMTFSLRFFFALGILLLFGPSPAPALQTKDGRELSSTAERGIRYNRQGDIIVDAAAKKLNYSKNQMKDKRKMLPANLSAQMAADISQTSFVADPAWFYAPFGSGIGTSNIVVEKNREVPEIYLGGSTSTFGMNNYWYVLRYVPSANEYRQMYVSQYFSAGIRRIRVANVVGDSAMEIIVALADGRILLYNQATRKLLKDIPTAADGLTGMDVADINGAGPNELILCTSDHLYVYSGAGELKWHMVVTEASDVVVAQMDDDKALEIAVTGGQVIDSATKSVQWTWSDGFGNILKAADIDGDGRKELIAAEGWYFVCAYDVEQKLQKWSIPTDLDVDALYVGDIDNDGVQELIIGDGQWGALHAYNAETQTEEWSINNPDHGVTAIAVADVDNDGKPEILWGAGASSTGPDHLRIADLTTRQTEWASIHLDGPFIGPEKGDLDGDGVPEIVVASWASESGYGSGRILVFSARGSLRAVSGEIAGGLAWTGTHDLKLRDVDNDNRMDILVAADRLHDGVIEVYGFDTANDFTLKWTNNTRPFGAVFYSVEAVDIDSDGSMEIIAGAGREHTGAEGVFLHVYDYATRNEKWHSTQMGGYWDAITAVGLDDIDMDGKKEIVGMVSSGGAYIFDGPSKELEAILPGENTAMRIRGQSIIFGDAAGDISINRYQSESGSYAEVFRRNYIPGPIDGFTISPNGYFWIGSGGVLFTIAKSTGETLWKSADYGTMFGRRTAFFCGSNLFVSSGSNGIIGFRSQCADWGK
jgi:hypothetical protein